MLRQQIQQALFSGLSSFGGKGQLMLIFDVVGVLQKHLNALQKGVIFLG